MAATLPDQVRISTEKWSGGSWSDGMGKIEGAFSGAVSV
jgi:hypothetical protein